MAARTSSILIGGDCGPAHGPADGFPIEGYTELVAPVLAQADFRFVNCMRAYSSRGVYTEQARQVCQPPEMADIFSNGRFDAVTMANNHSYDAGPDAMLDTRALFLSRGIQVTGAGRDLAEARRPAIIERNGIKVGYLGYTSVGHPEGTAGPGKPGVMNVRVNTSYEPRGPHRPVRINTEPHPDDLAMLLADIQALRKKADVAILAFHSGATWLPRIISDYQVIVAHAAIDAGADLVVCHAPHIPKAIEVYKGKAIFYSLGIFAMTKPFAAPAWSEPAWTHGAVRNHTDLDPEYPFMPYGKACTLSLLAKAQVSKEGVSRVSFLPMKFDKRYRPEVLRQQDPRFANVLAYMEWASQDMPHRFTVESNEVVVS
jgi:poly-gamma-glutamate synthesis protein (capsule biosynthesis protein)